MKRKLFVIGLVLLLAAATTAVATTIPVPVCNGDFEADSWINGGQSLVDPITCWTRISGNVRGYAMGVAWCTNSGTDYPNGILDLDGGAVYASAYQSLGEEIVEGVEYTLTFDWIIEWATGSSREVLQGKFIRMDNMDVLASLEVESSEGTSRPTSVWEETPFSLSYTAGAAEAGQILGIMIGNPEDAWVGADNVEVFKSYDQVSVITETDDSTEVSEFDETTDTYEIVMTVAPPPGDGVRVTVVSSDPNAIEPSNRQLNMTPEPWVNDPVSNSVVFTAANWSTPQTITVQARADDVSELSVHSVTLTHTASLITPADNDPPNTVPEYNDPVIDNDVVTVEITDDFAVFIDIDDGLEVSERAVTSDTYTLTLNTAPDNPVEVIPHDTTAAQVEFIPASVTFTSGDWNTLKTITVTAIDDSVVELDAQTFSIEHTIDTTDTNYALVTMAPIDCLINDNDERPWNSDYQVKLQRAKHEDIGRETITGDVFTLVPNISNTDLMQGITPTIRLGNISSGSADFITNGSWTADDSAIGLIFGDPVNLVQIDLGTVSTIGQINTYSRHNGLRLQQKYNVYGISEAAAPSVADFPVLAGWTHIAKVDTGYRTNNYDGILCANITDVDGNLGTFRYLLFEIIRPTGANETNYTEWDIRYCGQPGTVYLDEDIDQNCDVGLGDAAELAADWLNCTYLDDPACTPVGDPGSNYLDNCAVGAPNHTPGDVNGDCYVDGEDLIMIATAWLYCTDPNYMDCLQYYHPSAYTSVYYANLASQRWNAWRQTRDTFPIAAWSYFASFPGTVSEYTVYRDAGLSMVQTYLGTQYSNAVSTGLGALIGSWQDIWNNPTELAQYVNYPTPTDTNVWGYDLEDEPEPDLFPALATACEYIYENDQRNAIPIIDMLPNWTVGFSRFGMTYEKFSELLVEQVHPAVMLNCHYAILDDGTDRPEYFDNIELYRRLALEADIGLMGFALVTRHRSYREPSESDLFWHVYSYVTYGAKGMWYYNYRVKPGDLGAFDEGLVTSAAGTPTATYYLAQDVDTELKNIWHIFKHLRSTGVYHTDSTVPYGTTQYKSDSISVLFDCAGDEFLLGEFENMDDVSDDDVYVMLMNKRHAMNTSSAALNASATLTVDPAYGYVYYYNPATGSLELLPGSGNEYTVTLGGGHGLLLRFSDDPEL